MYADSLFCAARVSLWVLGRDTRGWLEKGGRRLVEMVLAANANGFIVTDATVPLLASNPSPIPDRRTISL